MEEIITCTLFAYMISTQKNGRDYFSVLINMERNSKKIHKFNMSVFEHLYIIDLGKKFKAN